MKRCRLIRSTMSWRQEYRGNWDTIAVVDYFKSHFWKSMHLKKLALQSSVHVEIDQRRSCNHVYDDTAAVNPPASSQNLAEDSKRKNPTPSRNFCTLAYRLVNGLA